MEENFYDKNILNRNNILNIYDLFNSESGKEIDLGKNMVARKSYGKVIIEEKKSKVKKEKFYLEYGENRTDFGDIFISKDLLYTGSDNFIKVIDCDKIKGKLYVRTRKRGDKFKPLGMKNNKKLKDYFIDRKVDRLSRDEIGLICDDEKIVCVIGMDISEDVKVDKKTFNKLNLEVKNVL